MTDRAQDTIHATAATDATAGSGATRATEPTDRPRRRPWVAIVVVVAALLAVAIATLDMAYGSTLAPIREGNRFWSPTGFDADCESTDEDRECRHYPFAVGGTLTFAGSIRNDGPLPVTVTGGPVDETVLVARMGRRLLVSEPGITLEGAHPFAPFVLRPGEFRMIVEDRVMRCPPMGGWADEGRPKVGYGSITVTYRLLATEHQVIVPLLEEVFMDYPITAECPPS